MARNEEVNDDQNRRRASTASFSPPPRPTITLPPRSFPAESIYSSWPESVSGLEFSPGTMTLLSNFFSDSSDDCKSFSQLLAGALASPAANTPPGKTSQAELSRPAESLSIVPQAGMSPMAGLLETRGFGGLFSSQGPFGMTHRQALAQVTEQAVQNHSHMQVQTDQASSFTSAPASASLQFSSFATDSTTHQHIPPSLPESGTSTKQSPEIPVSDQRSQTSALVVDKPADDGYNWRKYGQKQVKGSEFPRSYYKCTHPNCPVKKRVERSLDGQVTEIIYKGQHNHQAPQPNKRAKDAGSLNGNLNARVNSNSASQFQGGSLTKSKERKDQVSGRATAEHLSGTSDSEEVGDTESGIEENNEDGPDPKRISLDVTVTEPGPPHRTVMEPRIIVQTTSEVDLLDDGYRWRKYGQKVVKGNPHPRSYYKCTTPGCKVRKHVERAAADPRGVITTYEGKHNHDVPAAKTSSHNTANSTNASQLQPDNAAIVKRRDFGSSDQQPVARLRLKEEQIT